MTDLSESKKAMRASEDSQPPLNQFHRTISSQPLANSLRQHASEHLRDSGFGFVILILVFSFSHVIHLVKFLSVILSQYFTYNNIVILTALMTSVTLSQYRWVGFCMAKCDWMH